MAGQLDEELISRHEARQTVSFDDYFAVLPDYAEPAAYASDTGGSVLPEGFEHTSTNADRSISIERMREILSLEDI